MIFEYLINLKDQIGFYFIIIKVIVYFLIGSILIFLIYKISSIFYSLVGFFNKVSIKQKLYSLFKFIMFIFLSILLGWFVVYMLLK